jgi:hypothetical protein
LYDAYEWCALADRWCREGRGSCSTFASREGESAEVLRSREGRASKWAVRRRLGAADAALPEEEDGREWSRSCVR